MPRRASSGISPGILVAIAAAAAILFFGGKAFLGSAKGKTLDGSPLNMNTVAENANSLRGNEYVVEGRVDEKLRWTPDRGQLVSLRVGEGEDARFLSILIPDELADKNIERDQPYAFRVSFDRGGIAIAEEIAPR